MSRGHQGGGEEEEEQVRRRKKGGGGEEDHRPFLSDESKPEGELVLGSRNVMGQLKEEGPQGDTGKIRKWKGSEVVTIQK